MPPHPIPSSSTWGKTPKGDVKGKNTRYPVYAPPQNAAAAAALLKAEKKRAIVPSKPLRSPSLLTERSPLLSASASTASFQSQHSHYSSHSQSQFYHQPSTSSSSSHNEQHSSRSRVATTPTPIPVPQIPPRHPSAASSAYLHGNGHGSADGTPKPGQSSKDTLIIQERRSSHGATAPLSSSPLAQGSFISPRQTSSYGQDSRPSTSSSSLPSNHERLASSPSYSDGESSMTKPTLTPPRLPIEPEGRGVEQKKKPFYRPRPLWLVPFAILAALVRGMTLAPRVEVYTQLACLSPSPSPSLPPITIPDQEPPTKRRRTVLADEKGWTPDSAISLYASLDPMGPHLFPAPQLQRVPRALPPPPPPPSRRRNSTLPSTSPSLLTYSQPTEDDLDITRRPSQCSSSPLTQARAAKLQTLVSTTTGLLSALSTTFWGRVSSRYGRTRVLAIATLGLLTTDLVFALIASPALPWPFSLVFNYVPLPEGWSIGEYRQYLLLLGPLVEGTLGGWTSLQSAVLAYLSDCTSAGGRAGVFARFTGVFYVGFSVGPVFGGWVVRNSRLFERISVGNLKVAKPQESVVMVFWVAVVCSFVNFLLVLFVFPESLDKVRALQAQAQANPSLVVDTNRDSSPSRSPDSKGKARSNEYGNYSNTPTPIATRHPIFPIVEDVEIGGGDGFVDVDDLPSPLSPSSSGFLPSRSAPSSPTDSTPLLFSRPDAHTVAGKTMASMTTENKGVLSSLLSPLRVFLPTKHLAPTRNMLHLRYATDWSLTLLAVGLVGWMLSTGVYQIKYLYAGHVYGWGASELSEYVSWMGFVRAVVLLWIIPSSVTYLKERSLRREAERQARWDGYGLGVAGGTKDVLEYEDDGDDEERKGGKKKAPTRLQLGRSIRFDLRLARVSLLVDFVSNVLIAVTPSPSFHSSIALLQALRGEPLQSTSASASLASSTLTSASATGLVSGLAAAGRHTTITHAQSQAMFIAASSLSAFGGGLVPAVHSLALCIVQARGLEPELRAFARDVEEPHSYGSITSHYQDIPSHDDDDQGAPKLSPPVDAATLLSAFAVLQALSQSILAPLLFGFVYSSTVSTSPKLVFVLSAGLLMVSMAVVCSVRNPVGEVRAVRRERRMREGVERVQERLVAARKASVGNATVIAVAGSVGGKGVVVVSSSGQQGGGVVKATTLAPIPKKPVATPAKAIPPSLNLHAKPPVAPMPIVKRWERDMGRRGRSVVSKDLRGGAVSVSASYQDDSSAFQSYRDDSGLGGSVPGPSGHYYRLGSAGHGQQYRVVGGGQYGSLNAGQGRGYGSVSVGGSGVGSWKAGSGGA